MLDVMGKHYQKPFSTYNERIKWSFIIELSPWIGEFYKHLARIKKRSLLKIIEKLSLTSSQFQIVISEIEAIVNTTPFAYVDNKLKPRKIIKPIHFSSISQKIGFPLTVNNHEDDADNNINNLSSSKKLLEIRKKCQRQLVGFCKIWKRYYFLDSREAPMSTIIPRTKSWRYLSSKGKSPNRNLKN